MPWPIFQSVTPAVALRREHVAIVKPTFADLIEAGAKTIESRISKVRGPAFQRVHKGDDIYFRESGGGFRVSAVVVKAIHIRDLSPAGLATIRAVFGDAIGADRAYWRTRKGSRYASLFWLIDIRADLEGPALWRWPGFRDRSAWGSRDLAPLQAGAEMQERMAASRPIAQRRRA